MNKLYNLVFRLNLPVFGESYTYIATLAIIKILGA